MIFVRLQNRFLLNGKSFVASSNYFGQGWNLAVDDGGFYVIKTYETEKQALEALEVVQNKILDALEAGDEHVLISWDDDLLEIEKWETGFQGEPIIRRL